MMPKDIKNDTQFVTKGNQDVEKRGDEANGKSLLHVAFRDGRRDARDHISAQVSLPREIASRRLAERMSFQNTPTKRKALGMRAEKATNLSLFNTLIYIHTRYSVMRTTLNLSFLLHFILIRVLAILFPVFNLFPPFHIHIIQHSHIYLCNIHGTNAFKYILAIPLAYTYLFANKSKRLDISFLPIRLRRNNNYFNKENFIMYKKK
jgi:hypothetical protein